MPTISMKMVYCRNMMDNFEILRLTDWRMEKQPHYGL